MKTKNIFIEFLKFFCLLGIIKAETWFYGITWIILLLISIILKEVGEDK